MTNISITSPETVATSGGCGCGGCGCGGAKNATPELDARAIPPAVRHDAVLGALSGVGPGNGLIVVAPHDPKPLLQQISVAFKDAFAVEYLEQGPEAWRVELTRSN